MSIFALLSFLPLFIFYCLKIIDLIGCRDSILVWSILIFEYLLVLDIAL